MSTYAPIPEALFAAIEAYKAVYSSQGMPVVLPQTITLSAADWDRGVNEYNFGLTPPASPPIGARGVPWILDGVTILRGT
jgi:hypothetical protein